MEGGGWRPGPSIGIDIGGTKIDGVLLDGDSTVLTRERIPTGHGPVELARSIVSLVHSLTTAVGVRAGSLTGIGLGVPGLVDPRSGRVVHAVNLGIDGRGVALADVLSAQLGGVPVSLENDLNAAALGVARVLDLEGQDVALLALGTGLAAGLVLGGRLQRGYSGAAGEIGHIAIDPNGLRCGCGQRGCLETLASGSAIDASWPSVTGRPAPVELFEAAAAGDPAALVVQRRFADAVAVAVRVLVLTCDVQHVVLGGGVSALGQELLDVVVAATRRQGRVSPFLTALRIADRIRVLPQGVPVAAIGAALLVDQTTPAREA